MELTQSTTSFLNRLRSYAKLEPFEYRAQLHAFVGENWTVPNWELECWENKHVIRREWRAIEDEEHMRPYVKESREVEMSNPDTSEEVVGVRGWSRDNGIRHVCVRTTIWLGVSFSLQ
jgi:hypothetical protein